MRRMSKVALAGAAVCALAGTAYAADTSLHRMKVALPDGSVAHLLYKGDVAPRIETVPVERTIPIALLDSPFADFDRMFADMDRQAAAMLQQAAALQAAAPVNGKIDHAALKSLPAGSSYTFTSYSSSNGGCTQSYQMTSYGNATPKVVSQTSGNCAGVGAPETTPKAAKVIAPPKTVPHDAV